MTATLDLNVLLFASDGTSDRQDRALTLLDDLAMGMELVTLFWPTVLAFLRVATHPRVFDEPLSLTDALDNVESLTDRANVRVVGEGENFLPRVSRTLQEVDARGDLVPDGHLVALMRQHDVRAIYTHDRDFRLFDDIEVRDPFE